MATEASDELPPFPVPVVSFNSSGWGPTTLPERFASVPYAPFGKSDWLGKVADFSARARRWREADGEDGAGSDEESWERVDQARERAKFDPRKRIYTNRFRNRPLAPAAARGYDEKEKLGSFLSAKQQRAATSSTFNKRIKKLREARWAGRRRWDDRNKIQRSLSVNVGSDWNMVESADLTALSKLKAAVPEASDVRWCGRLASCDERFDRVNTKTAPVLKRFEDREFFFVTARWDPVIQELARTGEGNVFATDALMSHIMTCTRSIFPWDIVVTCIGGRIFFDVRDANEFELLTVNETAHETPTEEESESMNSQRKLSLEATGINHNFSQQILKEDEGDEEHKDGRDMQPHPFWDADDSDFAKPASVAYRYRKWNLGDGINLVARTTVHGVVRKASKDVLTTVFALNEWDSRSFGAQPWSKIIDAQRGAVMATELKNNAMKLAKWTASTLLAGADQMKVGFVARNHAADPHNHKILGTQLYMAKEFAHQVSLDSGNMWGIFKWLVGIVRKRATDLAGDGGFESFAGKFVLLKTDTSALHLYQVPSDFGEDEEESEEESESEDDEGAGGAGGR